MSRGYMRNLCPFLAICYGPKTVVKKEKKKSGKKETDPENPLESILVIFTRPIRGFQVEKTSPICGSELLLRSLPMLEVQSYPLSFKFFLNT